jgi:hypothetical protein
VEEEKFEDIGDTKLEEPQVPKMDLMKDQIGDQRGVE